MYKGFKCPQSACYLALTDNILDGPEIANFFIDKNSYDLNKEVELSINMDISGLPEENLFVKIPKKHDQLRIKVKKIKLFLIYIFFIF